MARLYLTLASVPELGPLSSDEGARVVRASVAAYARTPAFRWSHWLRWVLVLGFPVAAALIAYLVFRDALAASLAMVVTVIVCERVWFHYHATQLRPFIREVLQGQVSDAPAPAVEAWQRKPWAASLFFGAFMAGVTLLTEDRLPWSVLLPFAAGMGVVGGLIFGFGMRFLNKRMKGR